MVCIVSHSKREVKRQEEREGGRGRQRMLYLRLERNVF